MRARPAALTDVMRNVARPNVREACSRTLHDGRSTGRRRSPSNDHRSNGEKNVIGPSTIPHIELDDAPWCDARSTTPTTMADPHDRALCGDGRLHDLQPQATAGQAKPTCQALLTVAQRRLRDCAWLSAPRRAKNGGRGEG
jgi:hypothetical protein